jgi:sugar phosphate isomerase/epimerase
MSKHCNLLWSESSIDRSIIQQEYEAALSFCHRHRISIVVIHITQSFDPPQQSTSGLEIIRSLVSQAEKMGVIIAVENTTRPDYLEYVFSNIRSPNLGFCYDSSHDFVAREFRGEALKKWGSLLAATHLSDNKGIHDDHLLPGDGTIDWESVVQQFPKESYKGTIMLEVEGPEAGKGLTADEFLKLSYQKARQIAEMLEKIAT